MNFNQINLVCICYDLTKAKGDFVNVFTTPIGYVMI